MIVPSRQSFVDANTFKALLRTISANPSRVFLLLAIAFGAVFIYRMAPLTGTDEFTHFPRVYQIQQGIFWEQSLPNQQYGGYLPTPITKMVDDYRDLSRYGNKQSYEVRMHELNTKYGSLHQPGHRLQAAVFTSTVTYPPWAYVPSVLGVFLARILGLPFIWYIYFGRIASLVVWVILSWWAIQLLPRGKWFLVTVALLPTSLTQAATIGADGLLNGLSWLIVALVLARFATADPISKRTVVGISITSLYLCVIKDGYWLIAALPLILPISRFKSRSLAYMWKIVMILGLGCASFLFAIRTSHVASSTVLTPRLGQHINSREQMTYTVHHLVLFVARVLYQPFTKNYDTVYQGIVGIVTNRLIYLSVLVMGLLFAALFITLSRIEAVPTLIENATLLRATALIILVGTYVLLALAFYLGNTAVGSPIVFGMYGRYFLPLLPILAIFPLTSTSRKSYEATVAGLTSVILTVSLVSTAFSIG